VAIYTGGRTGPHSVAGKEVMEVVPCDAALPDVVAGLIEGQQMSSAGAAKTHAQGAESLPGTATIAVESGAQNET